MRKICLAAVVGSLLLGAWGSWAIAAGDGLCRGMLNVPAIGSGARIAGLVSASGAVSGIRWYNNDGSVSFPAVEVFEAAAGETWEPGVLLATLSNVHGSSDGWTELPLAEPISSRSGLFYVVFTLPAESHFEARGSGGGAAIGYASAGGTVRGFASLDGENWIGIRADVGISVVAAEEQAGKARAGGAKGDVDASMTASRVKVLSNPVTDGTAICYRLSNSGPVSLTLFDARGRTVRHLVSSTAHQGDFAVYWDGRDDSGRRAPSGTYIARLQLHNEIKSARLVLLH